MAQAKSNATESTTASDGFDIVDVFEKSIKQVVASSLEMAPDYGKISENFFRSYVSVYKASTAFWLDTQRAVITELDLKSDASESVVNQVKSASDSWLELQKTAVNAWLSASESMAHFWIENADEFVKANSEFVGNFLARKGSSENKENKKTT